MADKYGSELYGNYAKVKENITKWCDLSIEEIDNALRIGASKGVNLIAKIARQNLTNEVSGANNPLPEGGSLYKGIRAFTWKNSPSATVHIYGDLTKNDGTWRTRLYEGGTKKRYHYLRYTKPNGRKAKKRSKYIGKLDATWFFRDAVNQAESQIESMMTNEVYTKMQYIINQAQK